MKNHVVRNHVVKHQGEGYQVMTKPMRVVASLLVLALALGLAGCALVERFAEVDKILAAEGVETRALNIDNTNGVSTLSVAYATDEATPEAREAELERITRALWERAPFGFDYLDISAIAESGQAAGRSETLEQTFARSDLESRFGPRPEGLQEDIDWLPVPAALLLLAFVLVVLAVIVVVTLLVRRSRGRPAGPPSDPGVWPYLPGPGTGTPGAADPWRGSGS